MDSQIVNQFLEFVYMLVIDLMFMVGLILAMLPFGLYRQAAYAVMKRNFVGYFSNPTGYVFLCLFVLLTSFAAFWPHEFFTTNLANFEQLNRFLPFIMLVFIPAITMSIWAEERRQGTDELLLTLPARDFDIVIGKYFAAVLVFTVSLLFSQLSNYAVLIAMSGGELDSFLLFSTYFGYWFMGIAMLSIGMVASFLTNNLTVGFVFGAAFNAPLVFFSKSDVILSDSTWIQRLFDWSLLQRFEPFGRGLISLPSICYFFGIVVIGVYLSLILIGRRHWLGGRDGTSLLWHYLARAGFVSVIVVALVLVAQYSPLNQLRMDISRERVSTLADSTKTIITELAQKTQDEDGRPLPPIKVEAFISNQIPAEYVRTRYELLNLLRELDVMGGQRLEVVIHQGIDPFSQEAILAEQRFGIRPQKVESESRGAFRETEVILGVAISSGLQRNVIRFIPYGMPVEYELVRSIKTVSEPRKKTIGIVQTDAMVMGGSLLVPGDQNQQYQSVQIPPMRIVNELQNQYQVEEVDAGAPINLWVEDDDGNILRRRYDMLLAVQPSKMTIEELKNLIDAVQLGQPTAIFEDPFPFASNFEYRIGEQSYQFLTGSFDPRVLPRKGNSTGSIQTLWDALDLKIEKVQVNNQWSPVLLWKPDSENPYPRDRELFTKEWITVNDATLSGNRFSKDAPATAGLSQLCFQYTTYLEEKPNTLLKFTPLVTTGTAGSIRLADLMRSTSEEEANTFRGAAGNNYHVVASIVGDKAKAELPKSAANLKPDKQMTNVIYVADVDVLANFFVELRDYPMNRGNGIYYRFQNLAFVSNVIDQMASSNQFMELRTRSITHMTLRVVEETIEKAMQEVYELTQGFEKDAMVTRDEAVAAAQAELRPLDEEINALENRKRKNEAIDNNLLEAKKLIRQQILAEQVNKLQRRFTDLDNKRQEELRSIQLKAELKIQDIQRQFKLAAVVLPPIPPLLMGLVVFTRRRLREREGISKARRLK